MEKNWRHHCSRAVDLTDGYLEMEDNNNVPFVDPINDVGVSGYDDTSSVNVGSDLPLAATPKQSNTDIGHADYRPRLYTHLDSAFCNSFDESINRSRRLLVQ